MEFFKQYGSKERLFEMMTNVNKGIIKEDFDYNDAERDHLGQQDLADDQAQNPEQYDQSEPDVNKDDIAEGNNEKDFNPEDDQQVKELYILLAKDGIEDFREYYPDWVVDELNDHDYIIEDNINGTYQWSFNDDGLKRFPNPQVLKKFLIDNGGYNNPILTKKDQGEAPYLRGNEQEQ